jgi:predicted secreted protein
MSYVSLIAVYFVVWWITLFAVLPFSVKTQADDGAIVPGTEASAPQGPHMLRACVRTTIASLIIFGLFLVATRVFGWQIDDIPIIVPQPR